MRSSAISSPRGDGPRAVRARRDRRPSSSARGGRSSARLAASSPGCRSRTMPGPMRSAGPTSSSTGPAPRRRSSDPSRRTPGDCSSRRRGWNPPPWPRRLRREHDESGGTRARAPPRSARARPSDRPRQRPPPRRGARRKHSVSAAGWALSHVGTARGSPTMLARSSSSGGRKRRSTRCTPTRFIRPRTKPPRETRPHRRGVSPRPARVGLAGYRHARNLSRRAPTRSRGWQHARSALHRQLGEGPELPM